MQPNALDHVPTAFVQDVLIKLAPRILAGSDCLTVQVEEPQICDSSDDAAFPSFLRCSLSPPPCLPERYAIPPTHLLVLTFAATTGTREAEPPLRLMVPIHEAVWTLRCHTVAQLVSSSPAAPSSPSNSPSSSSLSDEPTATFDLPVLSFPSLLPLAAFSTFTVLHTYLHTATLPSHLPPPGSGPDDDDDDDDDDDSSSFDTDSDSDSEYEDEDEDLDFDDVDEAAETEEQQDDDEEEEEEDPQREQYEGLYAMCRAFGIADSDPIYEWMAAAAEATEERSRQLRGAAASDCEALFPFPMRRKRENADASVVEGEDLSSSSWSHLPTPPPG